MLLGMNAATQMLIDADIAAAALGLAVAKEADKIVPLKGNAVAVAYRHHGPRGFSHHLAVFTRASDCDDVVCEGCTVTRRDVASDAAVIETARKLLAS